MDLHVDGGQIDLTTGPILFSLPNTALPEVHSVEVPEPNGPRTVRTRRAGLFFLAFASGFAVLTIEIAGARLIAPVFGLSAVPWTAVIGVILSALALGSHIGGRLADGGRVPLSAVLLAAALAGILPVVGGSVPWMAREALGFIPGALASAVLLFAPGVLCLGAVVPYLVQADTESLGNVGRRAGDVSAAATAGSIAGTFATGFILLPAFSLPILLSLTSIGLLGLALLSGRVLGGAPPRATLALAAIGFSVLGISASSPPPDTLAQEQTLYASVRVTERVWEGGDTVLELWQNGGSSSAERLRTGEPAHPYAITSMGLIEPLAPGFDRVLVLGGAALTLPVALERRLPGLDVDVVEIDPEVTRLAEDFFAYGRETRPSIRVHHEDARVFLRRTGERYDLVYLDVFDNLVTVPWTMVTEEAFTEMAGRLSEGGVFMANVLSPIEGPGSAFLRRLKSTADAVFGDVRLVLVRPEVDPLAIHNVILMASVEEGVLPESGAPVADVVGEGPPLRDDWAPVELLQAKVFLGGVRWR